LGSIDNSINSSLDKLSFLDSFINSSGNNLDFINNLNSINSFIDGSINNFRSETSSKALDRNKSSY
jgi:hypothetical protein